MTSFLLDLVPAGGVVRALGALVVKPFAAAWRWITADYHRPVIVALLLALVVHWLWLDPAVRADRDDALRDLGKVRTDLVSERAAHAATIRNYEQAAAQAKAAQSANLTRVKAEQDAQSQRIAQSYENDLALLRSRRDHLAQQLWQAATGDPGVPATVYVPGPGESPGRTAQAPGDQGFPAACIPMNLDERYVASAQALQLDALIDWVEAQTALEMNP